MTDNRTRSKQKKNSNVTRKKEKKETRVLAYALWKSNGFPQGTGRLLCQRPSEYVLRKFDMVRKECYSSMRILEILELHSRIFCGISICNVLRLTLIRMGNKRNVYQIDQLGAENC